MKYTKLILTVIPLLLFNYFTYNCINNHFCKCGHLAHESIEIFNREKVYDILILVSLIGTVISLFFIQNGDVLRRIILYSSPLMFHPIVRQTVILIPIYNMIWLVLIGLQIKALMIDKKSKPSITMGRT